MTYSDVRPLLRALVTAIDFIENATDESIHPDYAVKMLEHIASDFRDLPAETLTQLHQYFQTLASEYDDPETQESVRNTLALMDLIEP